MTFDRPERTIDVGLHIVNIHQFSMKDKVYFVEGWYWLRWPKAIQGIIDDTHKELAQIVEFKNVVETASPDIELDSNAPVPLDSSGQELESVDESNATSFSSCSSFQENSTSMTWTCAGLRSRHSICLSLSRHGQTNCRAKCKDQSVCI